MKSQHEALRVGSAFSIVLLPVLACAAGVTTGGGGDGNGGSGTAGDQGSGGDVGSAGGDGGSTTTPGNGGSQAAGGGTTGSGGNGGSPAATGGSGGSPAGSGGQPATGGQPGSGGQPAVGGAGNRAPSTCTGHPYCNDFENLAVGARPFGNVSLDAGNKIAVSSTRFFAGKNSLQVDTVGGVANVNVYLRYNTVNAKRVGYARMMVWMEALPGGDGHFSIMGISGPADSGAAGSYIGDVGYGGTGANNQQRLLYGGGGSDCSHSASGTTPIATGRWVCVELQADETLATQYSVKLDGVAVAGLSFARDKAGNCYMAGAAKGIWYVPDFYYLNYGWNYAHTQGRAVRLYIDNIVADEKPIGCPAAGASP